MGCRINHPHKPCYPTFWLPPQRSPPYCLLFPRHKSTVENRNNNYSNRTNRTVKHEGSASLSPWCFLFPQGICSSAVMVGSVFYWTQSVILKKQYVIGTRSLGLHNQCQGQNKEVTWKSGVRLHRETTQQVAIRGVWSSFVTCWCAVALFTLQSDKHHRKWEKRNSFQEVRGLLTWPRVHSNSPRKSSSLRSMVLLSMS